jgi:dipeptidyl-peptidase-4
MPEAIDPLDEFPRQVARTRGFSLGVPRSFTVSADGERVVFLRTGAGDDPVSVWGSTRRRVRAVVSTARPAAADESSSPTPSAPAASARALPA